MSNPVTYWVQNDQVDKLCNRFGYNLEQLSKSEKKALRCVLSMWSIMAYRSPDLPLDAGYIYSESAWTAANIVDYGMCSEDVIEALRILKGLDTDYADGLIVAITAQLFD